MKALEVYLSTNQNNFYTLFLTWIILGSISSIVILIDNMMFKPETTKRIIKQENKDWLLTGIKFLLNLSITIMTLLMFPLIGLIIVKQYKVVSILFPGLAISYIAHIGLSQILDPKRSKKMHQANLNFVNMLVKMFIISLIAVIGSFIYKYVSYYVNMNFIAIKGIFGPYKFEKLLITSVLIAIGSLVLRRKSS